MSTTRARNAWAALCLVIIAIYSVIPSGSLARNILTWALCLLTVLLIATTTLTQTLWARSAWACVAGGTGLYLVAHMIWILNDRPQLGQSPITWLSAVLFAMAIGLVIAATVILTHRRRHDLPDASGFLDSAIVFVAASMLTAAVLIYPLANFGQLPPSLRIALITLPFLYVILLSTTVRLWYATDRKVNRAVKIFSVGVAMLLVSNFAGLPYWFPGDLYAGFGSVALTNFGAFLFLMLTGIAVLDPTATRPPAADVSAGLTARSRILVLLSIAILIPPVLLLWTRDSNPFTQSSAFVVLTFILAGLLALRVNLLVQGYREAIRREHLLREINAGLMRATEITDVSGALPGWASQLVEQPDVTCLLGTVSELSSLGIGPFGTRLRTSDGSLRYRTIVSVPGGRPQRRLAIETPDVVSSPAQDSLAVLGQSVGMALERLALSQRVVERAATERLELLLHNASDVITLVDDDAEIRYVTEAMRDLTGHSPVSVVGMPWPKLFQDPALARGLLDRARSTGEARGDLVMDPEAISIAIDRPDHIGTGDEGSQTRDRRVEVDLVWLPSEGQFVVTHHDVTDRFKLQQQLAFQAFHDELTGLNNRSVFREQLVRASARARRSATSFAVMMIDLDDFKNVNDSLGHPAGDELLREVARRIVECMREADTPVRLGGDEFAVILESAQSVHDAEQVGERLLRRLVEPTDLLGAEVVSSASIGVAMSDGHIDPADVERYADIALYEAKLAGRGRVAMFQVDMHDSAAKSLSMTNELRVAVQNEEMQVRYQPIVDIGTGHVAGAEALVRWNHPAGEELSPEKFIPIAEATGSIIDIGRFVMQRAIRDLGHWQQQFPQHATSRVTINVSVRQLKEDDIATALAQLLSETGVAPRSVVIEVTESVVVADAGRAVEQLEAIARLGVSVYLDDFGTGWASLHYLQSLPVSGLKLSQEFVTDLPNDTDDRLAASVRDLSVTMGLEETVAEGIETAVQRDTLARMGYRLAQGYLIAKPLLLPDLLAFLAITPATQWLRIQPAGGSEPVDRIESEPLAAGPAPGRSS